MNLGVRAEYLSNKSGQEWERDGKKNKKKDY